MENNPNKIFDIYNALIAKGFDEFANKIKYSVKYIPLTLHKPSYLIKTILKFRHFLNLPNDTFTIVSPFGNVVSAIDNISQNPADTVFFYNEIMNVIEREPNPIKKQNSLNALNKAFQESDKQMFRINTVCYDNNDISSLSVYLMIITKNYIFNICVMTKPDGDMFIASFKNTQTLNAAVSSVKSVKVLPNLMDLQDELTNESLIPSMYSYLSVYSLLWFNCKNFDSITKTLHFNNSKISKDLNSYFSTFTLIGKPRDQDFEEISSIFSNTSTETSKIIVDGYFKKINDNLIWNSIYLKKRHEKSRAA